MVQPPPPVAAEARWGHDGRRDGVAPRADPDARGFACRAALFTIAVLLTFSHNMALLQRRTVTRKCTDPFLNAGRLYKRGRSRVLLIAELSYVLLELNWQISRFELREIGI